MSDDKTSGDQPDDQDVQLLDQTDLDDERRNLKETVHRKQQLKTSAQKADEWR